MAAAAVQGVVPAGIATQDAEAVHTRLCESLLHRDLQALAQLLDAGGDPNSCSSKDAGPYAGDTPLTLAARMGDLEAVQLLVRARADVELTGPRQLTAMHEAAAYGRADVVKMLLACGAPTDGPSTRHRTPWRSPRAALEAEARSPASDWEAESCSETGDSGAVGGIVCSVAREGSVVLSDTEGEQEHAEPMQYTPLHAAAEWGMEAVLVILLESNASLYHVDESGQTAEDLAIAAQRQRKAQGYAEAAEARGRCAHLLKCYRRADQAQRRAINTGSETEARLRGYAAALSSCPESVRWRRALLAQVAAAASEVEDLFADTAARAREWAEKDRQQRIDDRADVLRAIAEHTQRLEAETQARVAEAARRVKQKARARKSALKSAVQKFGAAQKEADAAKLKLANGKTEMHPGWAVMRESILARLQDEAHSSKSLMVAAATELTELRKQQVRQAELDAAEMRRALYNAKQDAEQALAENDREERICDTETERGDKERDREPGDEEHEDRLRDPVSCGRRAHTIAESSEAAATERAAALAATLDEMRSAALQRLVSFEECEAALHNAAIYATRKLSDATEGLGSSGKQEQNQEVAAGLHELQEGVARCLAVSTELRVMRASATLACGGAAHAQSAMMDCLEELRRLRLQHAVLESMRRGGADVASKKSADDMARGWLQKTRRPHQKREQHEVKLLGDAETDAHGTESAQRNPHGAGAGSTSNKSDGRSERLNQWVKLLGRCIGAQLSTLIAPALEADVEEDQKRSAFVLAAMRSQADEAQLTCCSDEATRLGRRTRAALGTMATVAVESCTGTGKENRNIASFLVETAMAELQMYCDRRDAAERQAAEAGGQQDHRQWQGQEAEAARKQHEQKLLRMAESSLLHALHE